MDTQRSSSACVAASALLAAKQRFITKGMKTLCHRTPGDNYRIAICGCNLVQEDPGDGSREVRGSEDWAGASFVVHSTQSAIK